MERKTAVPQPVILYYTESAGKAQQIEMLCSQFGYRTRFLGAADAGTEVGVLAGISNAKRGRGMPDGRTDSGSPEDRCLPEHMIFSVIGGEQLDVFLQAMRTAGISPIPLKAVLTPYNYKWSLYELVQELQREHTAMMMERRKQ